MVLSAAATIGNFYLILADLRRKLVWSTSCPIASLRMPVILIHLMDWARTALAMFVLTPGKELDIVVAGDRTELHEGQELIGLRG